MRNKNRVRQLIIHLKTFQGVSLFSIVHCLTIDKFDNKAQISGFQVIEEDTLSRTVINFAKSSY